MYLRKSSNEKESELIFCTSDFNKYFLPFKMTKKFKEMLQKLTKRLLECLQQCLFAIAVFRKINAKRFTL